MAPTTARFKLVNGPKSTINGEVTIKKIIVTNKNLKKVLLKKLFIISP